ncbi:hypothetical protein BUALT_Bualt05G0008100 [Buddleja alternifolia]|uniref:RanBD1 domain-containing protein n=1 Tax=Buddleja alternifolia TaxID=168488 RepID=A0AAV6XFL2_9LAMI|nr:hypothetical protein BUALT_Bualt05G0008100 [Buddleja alternifolia]
MSGSKEPTNPKREEDEEDDSKPPADDEDTGAPVAPIVKLQEVAVTTGEENEDVLLDLKSKLYRFDKDGNQWKERGVGTVKLLKHKESGKVRLVMRQNKTLKICANHLVLPTMSVQEHQGNDKSCVWHAADFADGELKEEFFCIRFASVETRQEVSGWFDNGVLRVLLVSTWGRGEGKDSCPSFMGIDCKAFKDKIEEITESQEQDGGESEEGTTAANLIENLSVKEKEKEEKPEAKEAPSSSEEKPAPASSEEKPAPASSEEKPEAKEAPASSEEKKDENKKQEKSTDDK